MNRQFQGGEPGGNEDCGADDADENGEELFRSGAFENELNDGVEDGGSSVEDDGGPEEEGDCEEGELEELECELRGAEGRSFCRGFEQGLYGDASLIGTPGLIGGAADGGAAAELAAAVLVEADLAGWTADDGVL